MMGDCDMSRRGVIRRAGLSAGAVLAATVAVSGKEAAEGNAPNQVEVTPPEDLMREHAVLSRLLLIYEKALSAGARPADWPMAQLADAARLVRTFIEDYHEKLEEAYIFPRFEKAGKLADLVAVLRKQHDVGKQVTDGVLRRLGQGSSMSGTGSLADDLKAFIRLYRPHAERESTVLFPQIGSVVTPKEYEEMGDRFEEIEHQKFGTAGFEGVVQRVGDLEKSLGIYDLAQFTPTPDQIST
jgi:hemerythrin-like domain-containing protein